MEQNLRDVQTSLGRKARAALGPPPADYTPPALGGHPGPKSVTPLADELAGLIGALHDLVSVNGILQGEPQGAFGKRRC